MTGLQKIAQRLEQRRKKPGKSGVQELQKLRPLFQVMKRF